MLEIILQTARRGLPETALPQQWLLEKLVDEKTRSDDLLATLGGKLMNHYLYFQSRIKAAKKSRIVFAAWPMKSNS